MIKTYRTLSITVLLMVVTGALSAFGFFLNSTDVLRDTIAIHPFVGTVVIAFLMCMATIVAPITLLPLIPIIAPILGPGYTAFGAWLGWTLGSVIAFFIARYGGVVLLNKMKLLESVERFEKHIPEETHFWIILALRLMIPVDVLSYTLGLMQSVSFRVYVVATMLGIAWFSYIFAFMGAAFFELNAVHFSLYGVASAVIVYSAFRYVRIATAEKN